LTAGGVNPLKLSPSSTTQHIFEFAVKRSMAATADNEYECRFGLMDSTAKSNGTIWLPRGVFIRTQLTGDMNSFNAFAVDSSSPVAYSAVTLGAIGLDSTPAWRRFRLELSATAALFFLDGTPCGSLFDHLPTNVPLFFAFCVNGASVTDLDRHLLVDYFQHQIL